MSLKANADTQVLGEQIADLIVDSFSDYRREFAIITDAAQQRFESSDWLGVQAASSARLEIHNQQQIELANRIRALTDIDADKRLSLKLWQATKKSYQQQIDTRSDYALAETFFNSIHRELTNDGPVDDRQMFVHSTLSDKVPLNTGELYRTYVGDAGPVVMLKRIFADLPLNLIWQDQDRDIRNVLRSLAEARPEIESVNGLQVQILRSLFYRNKGAYAVGKMTYGQQSWPIAIPLLTDSHAHVFVDTLICDEDELSIMFSFTRTYFMVDTTDPTALVVFLQNLLPNKPRSELYASVGLHKHGKTEFYRTFLQHLENSSDQFIIAAGIKGMVMTVFTLPSFQTVFKMIKDRFAPQKNITAAQVKEKYHTVKQHDRVGRMADTQEFENLRLPRSRFSEELLEELLIVAPSSVAVDEDTVLIKHVYTERLMTPLNMYIEQASVAELDAALDEYGNAIKQLAAANIFPGDMLLKNFGVTRHGRVVFYDYDEICYLTEVNFREIPEPQTPEQEMSADIWYSVAPNDVFPEEFRRFLFGKKAIKEKFSKLHDDIFQAAYWRKLQDNIEDGQVTDVFPYRRKKRFMRQ